MSNEINALQKFFEYLTQTQKEAQDVVNEADVNGDTYLTKGEFKKYIDGVGLNLTADEVSQVFKIFDTNTKGGKIDGTRLNNRNALDDDEVKAMQDKLEAYQVVRNALDAVFGSGYEDVTIPTDLKPHVSRASVEESVMANMNSNFYVENLAALLTQAIARTGANGYGQAQFTKQLNEYKAGNYNIPASYNGDDDFQSLLSAYVRSLGADTALDGIIENVDLIVEAYFASAALCHGDEAVTEPGGYLYAFGWHDAQGLNGLQLARLADTIIETSGHDPETYNKFKSEFDAAIQGFISESYATTPFSEINLYAIGQSFANSKYGKALEVLITLSDFSEYNGSTPSNLNEKFYVELKGKLGDAFAQALAEADVNYVESKGLYYNILQTVYQMILSGEIDNNDDAIVAKMIELIIENYAEFKSGLGLGSANGDIDDLYNNVHTLVANNGALAAVRTAAIAYLDALTALGNEKLNSFIKTTFGEDYKKAIENLMSQSLIGKKIDDVQAKYKEMLGTEIVPEVEPSSYTAKWHNVTVPTFRVGGSSQSFYCTATIKKDPNDQSESPLESSTTNQITYGIVSVVSDTGSTATINAGTGEIKFTPGTTDGSAYIKVKVMVNGVEVGTKDIEVKVEKKAFNKSQGGIALGGIQIPVGGIDLGWTKSRDDAINNFNTNIADTLKQAAINQGFDATTAENAAKTLQSYFAAAMNAFTYFNEDKSFNWFDKKPHREVGVKFSYHNYATDQEVSESSGIAIRAACGEGNVNEYSDLSTVTSGTGIYIGCDATGTDDFWVFVTGQRMIDLFASFLG